MYNRNLSNRYGSTKSISTSTTLRNRSPSIQGNLALSPRCSYVPQSNEFIDNNVQSLGILKRLIGNQGEIVDYHRKWCSNMQRRIQNVFQTTLSEISSLLASQELQMKKSVEEDFCSFLAFFKLVKNKIRDLYSSKEQIPSNRLCSLKKKLQYQSNEYYVGQNLQARSCYDVENEERSKFRGLNHFYQNNQQILLQLSYKAQQHLRFEQTLRQRQVKIDSILNRFKDMIGHSVSTLDQSCLSLLSQ